MIFSRYIVIIAGIVVLGTVLVGGYFFYVEFLSSPSVQESAKITPDETDDIVPIQKVEGEMLLRDRENYIDTESLIQSSVVFPANTSPTYLWTELTIPVNAAFITFDLTWTKPGDGDFLTLHFNDSELFTFRGDVASPFSKVNSGPIPIVGLNGKTGQLLFTLHSNNGTPARVTISNLEFSTIPVDKPSTKQSVFKSVKGGYEITIPAGWSQGPLQNEIAPMFLACPTLTCPTSIEITPYTKSSALNGYVTEPITYEEQLQSNIEFAKQAEAQHEIWKRRIFVRERNNLVPNTKTIEVWSESEYTTERTKGYYVYFDSSTYFIYIRARNKDEDFNKIESILSTLKPL